MSLLAGDGIPYSECTLSTTLQAKAVTIIIFVVCGDCNGHSMTWGCDKNNSRGVRIDDFITETNGGLLNDESYTYLHPATGTFTAIDISLCSLNIVWRSISWMNLIHMVVIIYLPINKNNCVFLPDSLPRWYFSRTD